MSAPSITPIVVLLGGGLASFALSRAIRVDVIVCFFALGALIGPHALGLAENTEAIHLLTEIGLAFFLYEVGSHLSIKSLMDDWRSFLTLGPLYCTAITIAVAFLGPYFGLTPVASLLAAATVALSSTAVSLQIISADGEAKTPTGQAALAVLLFQDVLAVILLAIIPSLAANQGLFWLVAQKLIATVVAFALVLGFGRKLVRPFFQWVFVQEAEEVFTAAALFIVLLICLVVAPLGLSLPLGAFLAGITLAESNYNYLVQSELRPFRGLLLSLFFVTVGMGLDLAFLAANIGSLLLLTIILSAVKLVVGALVFMVCGLSRSQSIRASSLLAQGSEFGFALVAALLAVNFLDSGQASLFSGSIGISLAIAPLFAGFGCAIACKAASSEVEEDSAQPLSSKEVIFVEFSDLTRQLAWAMSEEAIPYRIHDRDWDRIALAKSHGFPAFFSNPDRPRTLTRVSLGHARAVVVTSDDEEVAVSLQNELMKVDEKVPTLFVTSNPELFEALSAQDDEFVFYRPTVSPEAVLKELLLVLGYERGRAAAVAAQLRDQLTRERSYTELTLPSEELELAAAA